MKRGPSPKEILFRISHTSIFANSMVFRFHTKVCAVFGGSRGIGKAISELLAVRGGNVAVISRYQDHTNECVDHLRALTSREQHLGLSCDVSSFTSVQNTVKQVQQTLGQLSVLVNAAGTNFDSLLLRYNLKPIEDPINTNLFGAIYTSQAALKDLLKEREGVIINIGSVVEMQGSVCMLHLNRVVTKNWNNLDIS